LVANFDKVTRAVKDFFGIAEDNSKKLAESYKRQNEELEQQEKILSRSSDAATRNIERRIKLEEAAGKDTTKLRQQLFNQQQQFLKAEIKLIEQRIRLEAASLSPEKARAAYETRLKLQQQLTDLVVDNKAEKIKMYAQDNLAINGTNGNYFVCTTSSNQSFTFDSIDSDVFYYFYIINMSAAAITITLPTSDVKSMPTVNIGAGTKRELAMVWNSLTSLRVWQISEELS
jgi:hypothetical protein